MKMNNNVYVGVLSFIAAQTAGNPDQGKLQVRYDLECLSELLVYRCNQFGIDPEHLTETEFKGAMALCRYPSENDS